MSQKRDRQVAAEALREAARVGRGYPRASGGTTGGMGAVGNLDKATGWIGDVRVTQVGGVPVRGDERVLPHNGGGHPLAGLSVDWPSWLLARADSIEAGTIIPKDDTP